MEAVREYKEKFSKRMKLEDTPEDKVTDRKYVADTYHKLLAEHPEEMQERFPLVAYGIKKNSAQYKKQFPQEFKKYFFETLANFNDRKEKLARSKSVRPAFFLSGGTISTVKN